MKPTLPFDQQPLVAFLSILADDLKQENQEIIDLVKNLVKVEPEAIQNTVEEIIKQYGGICDLLTNLMTANMNQYIEENMNYSIKFSNIIPEKMKFSSLRKSLEDLKIDEETIKYFMEKIKDKMLSETVYQRLADTNTGLISQEKIDELESDRRLQILLKRVHEKIQVLLYNSEAPPSQEELDELALKTSEEIIKSYSEGFPSQDKLDELKTSQPELYNAIKAKACDKEEKLKTYSDSDWNQMLLLVGKKVKLNLKNLKTSLSKETLSKLDASLLGDAPSEEAKLEFDEKIRVLLYKSEAPPSQEELDELALKTSEEIRKSYFEGFPSQEKLDELKTSQPELYNEIKAKACDKEGKLKTYSDTNKSRKLLRVGKNITISRYCLIELKEEGLKALLSPETLSELEAPSDEYKLIKNVIEDSKEYTDEKAKKEFQQKAFYNLVHDKEKWVKLKTWYDSCKSPLSSRYIQHISFTSLEKYVDTLLEKPTIDLSHIKDYTNISKSHLLLTKGVPTNTTEINQDFPNALTGKMQNSLKLLIHFLQAKDENKNPVISKEKRETNDEIAFIKTMQDIDEAINLDEIVKMLNEMKINTCYKVCNTVYKEGKVTGGHSMLLMRVGDNNFTFMNPHGGIYEMSRLEVLRDVVINKGVTIIMDNEEFLKKHHPNILKQAEENLTNADAKSITSSEKKYTLLDKSQYSQMFKSRKKQEKLEPTRKRSKSYVADLTQKEDLTQKGELEDKSFGENALLLFTAFVKQPQKQASAKPSI
jgi:hypothetical protein